MIDFQEIIRPFNESEFAQHLSNPHFTQNEVDNHQQFHYLFKYLDHLNAKIMVVENDYTDGDFLDDFAAYYVRCFVDYSRRCKRLHFFSKSISVEEFKSLVSNSLEEHKQQEIQNSYLGFIVVRPLPGAIIGRTLLATYSSEKMNREYPCTKSYNANLFGIPLTINSIPFQEQDTVVAACATVALWSAFHCVTDKFNTPAPRPAQITAAANSIHRTSRPIPSHGLNVEQICNAISDVGLEPEVFDTKGRPNISLAALIYGYLHAKLPVILGVDIEGVGLHAITLTGYSLNAATPLTGDDKKAGLLFPTKGDRLRAVYAHDDQIGPFCKIIPHLPAKHKGADFPIYFDGSWPNHTNKSTRCMFPIVAIIPIYNKIRITFMDVYNQISRIDTTLSVYLSKEHDYEWDIFLTTNNDFKCSLRETWHGYLPTLEQIMCEQFPRFLWRAIFLRDGKPMVEFIIDATDMERSLSIKWCLWHSQDFFQALQFLFIDMPPNLQQLLKHSLSPRIYMFLLRLVKENTWV